MSLLSAAPLSGLNAATTRLGVAAHNIANTATPGFRRQEVVQQAQPGGGVRADVRTAPAGTDTEGGSALATDVAQQSVALYSFKANLRVVQAQDSVLGALLNLKV